MVDRKDGDVFEWLSGRLLCLPWPWHQLQHLRHVGINCSHVSCVRCGRDYGVNHDLGIILPWSQVRDHHAAMDAMLREKGNG